MRCEKGLKELIKEREISTSKQKSQKTHNYPTLLKR